MSLPPGWAEAPLRDLVTPNRPRHAPAETPHLPFIGMENVEAHTMRLLGTVPAAEMKSTAVHFQPGDVLYGRLRPYLNKVYRPTFEGLCSAEFIVFPPSPALDPIFLQFYLNTRSFVSFASQLNTGDRPRVDFDQVGLHVIPVPPVAEQRRIVAALEEHMSRLDAAMAGLRRAQTLIEGYRTALRETLCGGQLQRKTTERQNATHNTAIPFNNWPSHSLGELLREPLRNGHSAKKTVGQTGVRTLTLTAVTLGDFGEHNTKLTVADPARVEDLWLEPDDILIERSNTPELVGTARRYVGPPRWAIFPDLLIRVRVSSALLPQFAELVLQSEGMRKFFRSQAKGVAGTMPKIDQETVGSARFRVPPIDVQRAIVDEFARATSILRNVDRNLEVALNRSAHIRQAILKRAFEGELVAQNRSEQPATVILEHIRSSRPTNAASRTRVRRRS